MQCWLDSGLDVFGLTETWHEDSDGASLRRLLVYSCCWRVFVPFGWDDGSKTDDVFYQNHGRVAVIASAAVMFTKLNALFEPVTMYLRAPHRQGNGRRKLVRLCCRLPPGLCHDHGSPLRRVPRTTRTLSSFDTLRHHWRF